MYYYLIFPQHLSEEILIDGVDEFGKIVKTYARTTKITHHDATVALKKNNLWYYSARRQEPSRSLLWAGTLHGHKHTINNLRF